jgi:heme exporter protein CcmD
MNQWAFVIAAYAVTLTGMGGLVGWSLLSCRRAESQAERLGRRP